MSTTPTPVFVFPGAGGDPPDTTLFTAPGDDPAQFVPISYPNWRTYIDEGLSADGLVDRIAARIDACAPRGPLRILGISIGGHLGYATALRLQAMGRRIVGLCAVDSVMINSPHRSPRWKERILTRCADLLRRRRAGALVGYCRRLCWRAAFRTAGHRLPDLLRNHPKPLRWLAANDSVFGQELTMRLLIWTTAAWVGSLDENPPGLDAPATLLRTRTSAGDDDAWRRRCPRLDVIEIGGDHDTMFEIENADRLRSAFGRAWRATAR